ncbi:MAG: methyltransferase domain-containing protein [Armatimonadetes bacterium]|nr:methyltransferase domain-containing protein [Anaerolineae bacterium]
MSKYRTASYELEIAPGLKEAVLAELAQWQSSTTHSGHELIQLDYSGDPQHLAQLKTVNAVYLRHTFAVPRPKALLGHQHFQRLVTLIETVMRYNPPGSFQTLHIDAAGSDSSVMQRLKTELAVSAGLLTTTDDEKGDLLIRLRRSLNGTPDAAEGWDALVRLTPRPSATRTWRVQNYEGALNAAVAHAMVLMTRPAPTDVFLNICCGSGTLLIERMSAGDAQAVIGCDIAPIALSFAQLNLEAARLAPQLLHADARRLPLADSSVDALCADLPFGQLIGSHHANERLYPAVLTEAARVARPEARFVIVTHEIRLMESLLRHQLNWRQVSEPLKITLNGLHPRIYTLRRT